MIIVYFTFVFKYILYRIKLFFYFTGHYQHSSYFILINNYY